MGALKLWISRDYLWISALPCGEVPVKSGILLNPCPHMWAGVWNFPKM
jgi:hypothetical protein